MYVCHITKVTEKEEEGKKKKEKKRQKERDCGIAHNHAVAKQLVLAVNTFGTTVSSACVKSALRVSKPSLPESVAGNRGNGNKGEVVGGSGRGGSSHTSKTCRVQAPLVLICFCLVLCRSQPAESIFSPTGERVF